MTASRTTRTESSVSGGSRSPADEPTSGGLLLVAGEGILKTFPLTGEQTIIGRANDCDVVIDHSTLSRRHARLRFGTTATVEDLGSKNGTVVNDRRLARGAAVALTVGEAFYIGRFSLVMVRPPRSRSRSGQEPLCEALRVVDPTVKNVGPLIRDIARSDVNALIVGETGVGKEILAETLHRLSGRQGAFVRVNCAALAPALIESELFGYAKGAFTGATQDHVGLLESAARGTVFLDEIGELPEAAQAKLLRVIETRQILRVGAVRPVLVDVRFLAATNRDLPNEVASGRVSEDLFFRRDGVTLAIPPLRERRERIEPLARLFLQAAHDKTASAEPLRLAPGLVERLRAHDWPGNVRELKAVLERAVLLAGGGEIAPRHVALTSMAGASSKGSAPPSARAAPPPYQLTAEEGADRLRLLEALKACNGNQTRAAKHLGIARTTLVNKLAIYRIPRPRK